MNNVQLVMKGLMNQNAVARAGLNAPAIKSFWTTCRRSDLMLWVLDKLNFDDDMLLRLYACACVRKTPVADGRSVWDLLTDSRSRNAVETAERFAKGEVEEEENDGAWEGAMDTIWTEGWSDSGHPCWNPAKDSMKVAAREAARNVAERNALQAAIGASWSSARAAGSPAAIGFQADLLREMIPWEEIEGIITQAKEYYEYKSA